MRHCGNVSIWNTKQKELRSSEMTMIMNEWAKEVTGIGDCIVIPANEENPGVVKLVLVDSNGSPANKVLVQAVYDHIVSLE
ncbi:baseplate J/gp47 family protein [Mediterraneibacter gnavus]|uniref:baseplate J/gp47 family protein n=1 Tax=Mediterraneibacter gnavus TaxID=33038 RepID=UPI0036D38175